MDKLYSSELIECLNVANQIMELPTRRSAIFTVEAQCLLLTNSPT